MNFLSITTLLIILIINISIVLSAPAGDSITPKDDEEMMGEILHTETSDATEYANKEKRLFEDLFAQQTKEERLLNIRKLREKNIEEQRRRRQERRRRRRNRGNKTRVNRNTRR